MAITMQDPPLKSKFTDDRGFVSAPWVNWIRQLILRVGGNIALTNIELADFPSTLATDIAALQTLTATHTAQIAALQVKDNDLSQEPVA